jgi:DNA-binding transcriptional ArsR family regulator
VFRVHFTAADIARTRIAPPPGPLAEVVFSLDALHRRGADLLLDGWRRQMPDRVDRTTRMLTELMPRAGAFDLISLAGPAPAFEEAIDRFRAAPRSAVQAELEGGVALMKASPPRWAGGLLDRDGATRSELAAALRRYFRVAVAPYWRGIRSLLEAERRRLARLVGEHGVETLLGNLHPSMRWQPPVLHIQSATIGDHDCHLQGRGLAIVPSLFCPAGYPVCRDTTQDSAPFVLFFPAVADPFALRTVWSAGAVHTDASLVALLGKTRARVLQSLGDGTCSTTDLARRAGVAVSSASEHATVLRRAGLVDSRRHRSTVFHGLTALGLGVLDATPPRTRRSS